MGVIEVKCNIFLLSSGSEYMANSNLSVDNSSRFICPSCGPLKSYKTKGSLTRHLKYECDVNPMFECEKCGKKFNHKHHLTFHIKNICKMPV